MHPSNANNRALLVWALVVLTVGAVGMVVMLLVYGGSTLAGDYSSVGQQIYYTGTTDSRVIPRSAPGGAIMGFRMMGNVACVNCHGEDGRGGNVGMMFGRIEIPDIRYSALTDTRLEDGEFAPAWTDQDIARAIRDGIEPDSEVLLAPMPRWDMTDSEVSEVIAYLKELSDR